MYKDVQVVEKPQRSAAELREELERRLKEGFGKDSVKVH